MNNTCDFLETYAKGDEAREINNRLLELYKAWYKSFDKYEDEIAALPSILPQKYSNYLKKYTDTMEYSRTMICRPLLLTCTDSYLDNRIITFGKEANDSVTSISDDFEHLNRYQQDIYYSYDNIFLGTDTVNHEREYEKARRTIKGSLNNNLNKVSFGGKSTPIKCYRKGSYDRIEELDYLYKKFEFEHEEGNIFFHELRILKPNTIFLWCGKGYNEHIIRAFGENAAKTILAPENIPSIINPVSDFFPVALAGTKVQMVYSYHPSYFFRLGSEMRDNCFDKLKKLYEEITSK